MGTDITKDITKGGIPPGLQQDLFQITDGTANPELRVYSNILEIWDMLPKYDPYGSSQRYHKDLDINEAIRKIPVRHPIHREHLLKDTESFVDLELHITPARIEKRRREWVYLENEDGKRVRKRIYVKDDDGNYITEPLYVYPGAREDSVEEALKYLLSHGQGTYDQERTGVNFSVKQIYRELKRTGSTMSLDEIKESLEVLARSRCEIYGKDANGRKRSVMGSPFLPNLIMVDRQTYLNKRAAGDTETVHCYAQFHIAVTLSIQSKQFRITHYHKHQRLRNLLARFIHKILRTRFLNASYNGKPFEMSFNTLMAEFGRGNDRSDTNVAFLETALKDLQKNDILDKYEVIDLRDMKDSRRILDRTLLLYPTSDFVNEMIQSNSRHKKNLDLLSDYTNITQTSKQVSELSEAEQLTLKDLLRWDITTQKGLELLGRYPSKLIQKVLEMAYKQHHDNKLKNPSGYILRALEEGWFSADTEEALFDDKGQEKEIGPKPRGKEISPNEGILKTLPEDLAKTVTDQWAHWDKGTRNTFNRHGLNSPDIREKLGIML